MGKRLGWLGSSLEQFLQFIREFLASEYDWGLFECTWGFAHVEGLKPLEESMS